VVLAFLFYWGNIDLRVLVPLADEPWTMAATAALVLLTLPLSALRWAIVLRALDISLPYGSVFNITCIATFVNQTLFGPVSGDAIRWLYMRQMLRRGGSRIAVSIIIDRGFGLFALIIIATVLTAAKWDRVNRVPELELLLLSLLACMAAGLSAVVILLAAPSLLSRISAKLRPHPRAARVLNQAVGVLLALGRKPAVLGAALALSILVMGVTVLSLVVIAQALHVGNATGLDVSVAAPLAMLANILPFTPGGLGIGEAAFDQVCRWLAPAAEAVPYATIFFAFRAVSMVTLVPTFIAFVLHRHDATGAHSGNPLFQEQLTRL